MGPRSFKRLKFFSLPVAEFHFAGGGATGPVVIQRLNVAGFHAVSRPVARRQ
jgi:hypothetical protein